MTAIIVAGRSARRLGRARTMRVSEEIDALRTLGLDPYALPGLPAHHYPRSRAATAEILADVIGIAEAPGRDAPARHHHRDA